MDKEREKKGVEHSSKKTRTVGKSKFTIRAKGAKSSTPSDPKGPKKAQASKLRSSLFIILFCGIVLLAIPRWITLAPSSNKTEGGVKVAAITFTKNNEYTLPALLKSVQGKVELTIVCDAQSMDESVYIAESMGAEILYMKSSREGTIARNMCLLKANQLLVENKITHFLWLDATDSLAIITPAGNLY